MQQRKEEDALRSLGAASGDVDFSSNDYLGLSVHPEIIGHSAKLLEGQPKVMGATGSRLLTGDQKLYAELESQLADFFAFEDALIFNSGYDANLGLISSVPQRNDLIFYDELVHASIREGIQLGNAKAYKFAHNDIEALNKLVERRLSDRSPGQEAYVITESVFSMDGDSPDLVRLAAICDKYGLHLIVDEAHALGVFGKGLVHRYGLQNSVFAQIVTFGKAMGSHGAVILGSAMLKAYLLNFARSVIYTTALPGHSLAAICAAFDFFDTPSGRLLSETLGRNIALFKKEICDHGLEGLFLASDSAIQVAMIPGNAKVKALSGQLASSGYDVRPILAPTVKEGNERLRFCIHAFNTPAQIEGVVKKMKHYLEHGE
ncbi:8-amino-7-oxononanoate synthase [Flagellimonas sp. DF-77]|uniref:aminotransferase class I/II-fold pyridoxal phosphate-dependent enzyme n=1 Tax=Flagellimonas algarum TaxID=3230298 RepID=UPI00339A98A0